MKTYIKDGVVKKRSQIIIRNDKGTHINPNEKTLLANGWEEYVTPVYEPTIDDYRKRKKDEILRYDSSEEVNRFYMQGEPMWLDFEKRSRLLLRFQAETAKGNETTTLWGNGKEYALPLSVAIDMLHELETYASKCYDNTQRHIAAVDLLQSKEAIESYDYRVGYPEKLEL